MKRSAICAINSTPPPPSSPVRNSGWSTSWGHRKFLEIRSSEIRVGIYARVTKNDGGQTPENQLLDLRKFAAAQNWQVAAEYVDLESGAKSDRPQFRALMEAAAQRKLDILLFWSLDRLSREGPLPTLQYLNRLSGYNVAWRSFTEPYLDTTVPFGEAIVAVLTAVAKQERLRLVERVQAGLARARATGTRSGRPIGRPKVIFRRDQAVELRQQGFSLREIARRLHVSFGTIRRVLQQPAAAPEASQNPVNVEGL
jgi:DNA invertase Pin-like site-specific DNA recombinase